MGSYSSATKAHPTAKCKGCKTRLLKPSKSKLCRFCEIERGLKEPV